MNRISLCAATLSATLLVSSANAQETGLDRYVAAPDSSYRYDIYNKVTGLGYDAYYVLLTSQTWRNLSEVDRNVWEHELVITVPWLAQFNAESTGILVVSGGRNRTTPTDSGDEALGVISLATNAVTALLSQVPNQPLYFSDEPDSRKTEDDILAYSLDKFLVTGDETWPVHVAMTKSVVRAMDAIQELVEDEESFEVEDFVVLGGSKRGWTTWLTAAVDDRVKGIVPASIDMMRLDEQFEHHWNAYGFFAPAVRDYAGYNIPCRMDTPRGQELLSIVDPATYIDRYTMPKLLLNSAGDQFFLTDSSKFYYEDLLEPKRLRYSVNTDHTQAEFDVLLGGLDFIDDVIDDKVIPNISWELGADGILRAEASRTPERVRLWQAHNPIARDFRLEAIGEAFNSTKLSPNSDGVYSATLGTPSEGWSAYTIEFEFDTSNVGTNQIYTTETYVFPEDLPHTGTYCSSVPTFRGMWWDPDFSGQGMQINRYGNTIFGAWFLYDSDGQDAWYTFAGELNNNFIDAPIIRHTGPELGGTWDVDNVESVGVGNAVINIGDHNNITMDYNLSGVSNRLKLEPFLRDAVVGYSGMWWQPDQSGQGIQFSQFDETIFGTWYVYDASGKGTWLTFQADLDNNKLEADLLRFTGPALGTPWDSNNVSNVGAGDISVNFTAPNKAELSYTLDGVSGTLDLIPFRF